MKYDKPAINAVCRLFQIMGEINSLADDLSHAADTQKLLMDISSHLGDSLKSIQKSIVDLAVREDLKNFTKEIQEELRQQNEGTNG